jgi:hypothetical protein
MKKRKIKKLVIILVIILLALIGAILSLSGPGAPREFVTNRTFETWENLFLSYEIIRYPSHVEIIKQPELGKSNITVGVVVDPWNLNFGVIPTGGSRGRRFLILTNLKEKEAKIKLRAYGNISSMIGFGKNDFTLNKNENITVDVFLYTSETTLLGNYSGEIDVIISRPKYDFLYNFLE